MYDTKTTNRERVVIRDMSAVVDLHLSVFRGRFFFLRVILNNNLSESVAITFHSKMNWKKESHICYMYLVN